MGEDSSRFLGRLLGRKKPAPSDPESEELPIAQATVGLCFACERGLRFGTEYHSDTGLEHIFKVLADKKLRATFFCPAKSCEASADHLLAIVQAGHELGALGYADESPPELTDEAIRQLVYACRSAFAHRGLEPLGFRSPQAHWDPRLADVLARQRFRYSAEHDHAKRPYVLQAGSPPLIRVPICTDDQGLRHGEETVNFTTSKHHRYLRKAITRQHFVSICFRPWLLAEEWRRMTHWEEWLNTAVDSGARVCALEDVLPDAHRASDQTGVGQ